MSDTRKQLEAALQALLSAPCARSLAANSLKLRFDFQNDPKGRKYLWIDPPWRLTLGGTFVTGSADCPRSGEDRDRQEYGRAFNAWSALFDPLNLTSFDHFTLGWGNGGVPDLLIRFGSGHCLETFGNYCDEDCWWYFKDRVSGDVFEAGPNGIAHFVDNPAEPDAAADGGRG